MFTGIVEELGQYVGRDGARFRFTAATVLDDAELGSSIAVNGACLTVVAFDSRGWEADVVDETLARTSLERLAPGDRVNLERPVRLADRLSGHLVQGHVDAVGEVVTPAPDLSIALDPSLLRFVAPKGSVAVDGVSLTVVRVLADRFSVAIVPHTSVTTTLGQRRPGDPVNVEVDILAKYLARLLGE